MALGFKTQTFQNTFKDLEEKIASGEIQTREQFDEKLSTSGVSREDYFNALDDYKKAIAEGESAVALEDDLGAAGALVRTAGRFAGEVAGGAGTLANLVTLGYAGEVGNEIMNALPKEFAEELTEIFDPYHGDDLGGTVEDTIGTMASYIVGGGLLTKGASKAAKALKPLGSGSKTATEGTKSLISKRFKDIEKSARKAAVEKTRRRLRTQEIGKETVGFGAAATLIDDPKENVVNVLIESFPESRQYLDILANDPNDPVATQYLQSFLVNLGLGGVFAIPSLVMAYKKPIAKAAAIAFKPAAEALEDIPYLNKLPQLPALFSSRMGTDDTMLSLIQKNSKAAEAGMIRAEGVAAELSQALKKEYGDVLTDEVEETVFKALSGNPTALASLKPEVKSLVSQMRNNVDDLSGEILKGTKGKLQAKIDKGRGVYITRSYNFFDDPVYRKDITKKFNRFVNDGEDPDGAFSAAVQSIVKATGESPEKSLGILKEIMRLDKTQSMSQKLSSVLQFGQITTAKGGLARKKVPDAVKALLGEEKNPFKAYVNTMTNLSKLSAEQKFLADTAKHLGTKFKDITASGVSNIEDVGIGRLSALFGQKPVTTGQVVNPLEGVLASKEYRTAIQEGLNLIHDNKPLYEAFLRAKGLSQVSKTALNIATHGRNIMGNMFLMVANGFFGPSGYGKALKSTASNLIGKTNKELAEQMAEYVQLGIVNSGVNVNVIRNNLRKMAQDPDLALLNTIKRSDVPGVKQVKGVTKKFLDVYQAEDDFFKIAHFQKTMDYLKNTKKYAERIQKEKEAIAKRKGNINELNNSAVMQELKEEAAQRTRDLLPNYNLLPKGFKQLRNLPVGDFLAFPAEMTRITKNLFKYTMQDLKSGDAELVKQGAKRTAGMVAAGYAPYFISEKTRLINGITEDQAEALENIGKDWEYNQNKIYLSPIKKDKNNHYGVEYLNLGPIDPFAYLKSGAQTLGAAIFAGVTDDQEIASRADKLALSTLDNVLGPFLAPSMVTNSLATVIFPDRYGNTLVDDVAEGKLAERLSPLLKTFIPGTIDQVLRRMEYNESAAQREPLGMEAIKKYGTTYKSSETDLLAQLGWKRDYLDITNSINMNIPRITREADKDFTRFKKKLQTEPNLNDSKELSKEFYNSQMKKYKEMQKLRATLKDYQTILEDEFDSELYKGLSAEGRVNRDNLYNKYINNALNNRFFADYLDYLPLTDVTKPNLDMEELNYITNQLSNTYIFDEDE